MPPPHTWPAVELVSHRDFGTIRVVHAGAAGEPWFCGKDAARILGYKCPRHAIARHVSENQRCTYEALRSTVEGGTDPFPPSEMQRQAVCVNEAGLYSLILRSDLPSAIAFKNWVCEEILPSLRRNGTFSCVNERDLHTAFCAYARERFPTVRISPGLGEMQDTSGRRLECWRKGYQKGQPDLIVHQRSGNFSGLAIELKTPQGTGVVSPHQTQWMDDLARAGYRTLISSSLDECVQQLTHFMSNARVCCEHCGSSFKTSKTLQTHVRRYHPLAGAS